MLNKSKSNKRNILKIALILPVLAIFLVSFNTKDVYIPIDSEFNAISIYDQTSKIIEITIDKNTTDKELSEIKKDLAKKGVDFSYTVVHNSKNEITDISIDFATKKDNGKTMRSSSKFNNGDDPIDPIHIIFNEDTKSISMGNAGLMEIHEDDDVHIDIHADSDKSIWVYTDSEQDGDKHKTIKIIEKNGEETIIVNGKEVSREELEEIQEEDGIHEKHIKIKKSKGDKEENKFIIKKIDKDIDVDKDEDKNVFIMKMSNDDDVDIIDEKEGKEMFIIKSDSDDKPMFIIDGIESTEKEMNLLNSSNIESINVLKGEMAQTKYGKKGKNGVVEITTKKQ